MGNSFDVGRGKNVIRNAKQTLKDYAQDVTLDIRI